MLEYCDSDALILELGVSYNDGFDDALCQVKALYLELDLSSVNISVPEPTPFTLISQRTQMSSLETMSPSPMPLWS